MFCSLELGDVSILGEMLQCWVVVINNILKKKKEK